MSQQPDKGKELSPLLRGASRHNTIFSFSTRTHGNPVASLQQSGTNPNHAYLHDSGESLAADMRSVDTILDYDFFTSPSVGGQLPNSETQRLNPNLNLTTCHPASFEQTQTPTNAALEHMPSFTYAFEFINISMADLSNILDTDDEVPQLDLVLRLREIECEQLSAPYMAWAF
ncbi:hypothetical protein AC578_9950 [Pseudocercospora eumusae]|uniref:Uncharacterized protein n=1 Tax=Pseudocercospora eumusae TaxID=321146 RepID=A0A139H0D4_9PEZI|nr:hypothetical protein AC578_9950 [Pseudocercospora eumusae]